MLGKFLPYHAGHAYLIRSARAHVDELVVLVCSIAREPIPGTLRHRWVADAHPDCRVLHVDEEVPQTPEEDPRFWPIWTDVIERHAGKVDVVFTSESYGPELARHIGATHVSVDPARIAVPVSGTAIRDDPFANWDYIPASVRPHYLRRVVIDGAESTGKTLLAQALARAFDTVWVPEYGREYCETRDPLTLDAADFDAIGRGQLALEDELELHANRVLICDTDLHTTCTWSDMIIGSRPQWLREAARARRYDLAILLDADVPWVDDGTRVLADRRAEHTERLRAELESAGQPYMMLRGTYEQRFAAAKAAIETLMRAVPARQQPPGQ